MYLLYSNESDVDPGLTVKIIGNQWYWNYEGTSNHLLKDDGKRILIDYKFDSVIIGEEDLIKGGKRLLETDNSLILPFNVIIRFLIHHLMYYMLEQYQN
jgi:cytochrome c oxidase subunit 2